MAKKTVYYCVDAESGTTYSGEVTDDFRKEAGRNTVLARCVKGVWTIVDDGVGVVNGANRRVKVTSVQVDSDE